MHRRAYVCMCSSKYLPVCHPVVPAERTVSINKRVAYVLARILVRCMQISRNERVRMFNDPDRTARHWQLYVCECSRGLSPFYWYRNSYVVIIIIIIIILDIDNTVCRQTLGALFALPHLCVCRSDKSNVTFQLKTSQC